MKTSKRFLRNESGVTAIEYAVIAAFISLVAFSAMGSVGSQIITTFNSVKNNWGGVGTGNTSGSGGAGGGS